jgi:hypothetical protein
MWKCACLTVLLFLSFSTVFGQSDNGSITGFARDPSGAVIPKAKVTLKNEATGVRQEANTNDSGYYIFNSIEPGLHGHRGSEWIQTVRQHSQ